MLQGRSFIYWDAQRYRLGPGFRKIPVNGQRNWTSAQQPSSGLGECRSGREVRAESPRGDDFSQAGEKYRALSQVERAHLCGNLAPDLRLAAPAARRAALEHFKKADPELEGNLSLLLK